MFIVSTLVGLAVYFALIDVKETLLDSLKILLRGIESHTEIILPAVFMTCFVVWVYYLISYLVNRLPNSVKSHGNTIITLLAIFQCFSIYSITSEKLGYQSSFEHNFSLKANGDRIFYEGASVLPIEPPCDIYTDSRNKFLKLEEAFEPIVADYTRDFSVSVGVTSDLLLKENPILASVRAVNSLHIQPRHSEIGLVTDIFACADFSYKDFTINHPKSDSREILCAKLTFLGSDIDHNHEIAKQLTAALMPSSKFSFYKELGWSDYLFSKPVLIGTGVGATVVVTCYLTGPYCIALASTSAETLSGVATTIPTIVKDGVASTSSAVVEGVNFFLTYAHSGASAAFSSASAMYSSAHSLASSMISQEMSSPTRATGGILGSYFATSTEIKKYLNKFKMGDILW